MASGADFAHPAKTPNHVVNTNANSGIQKTRLLMINLQHDSNKNSDASESDFVTPARHDALHFELFYRYANVSFGVGPNPD